jgi:hypothetical protein
VQVSVQAQGSAPIHYQWRAPEGTIVDSDNPTTSWTPPGGGGLHSVYVLVSNQGGGYTERRLVVNTDGLSSAPPSAPAPVSFSPPASAANSTAGPFRLFSAFDHNPPVAGAVYSAAGSSVLTASGFRAPASGSASADLRGEVVFSAYPAGAATSVSLSCALSAGAALTSCGNLGALWAQSVTLPGSGALSAYAESDHYELGIPDVANHMFLSDGSLCGTLDELFGVATSGTVSVLDAQGRLLYGPAPLDAYGGYALPLVANGFTVQYQCGTNVSPLNVNYPSRGGVVTLLNPAPPSVSAMSASIQNGQTPANFATMVPPQTGLPSDKAPRSDHFLSEKGIDSRLAACRYYQAVGAVQSCDAQGNYSGAVSFQDWKRTVQIDSFAPIGTAIYRATFLNQEDLNLVRVHASVSYSAQASAAYVCNYPGPQSLTPTQGDIDTAIAAAVAGQSLIGCFAMDYSVSAGANGGSPFMRFLIFGPSGALLPSVNLDTRGEKFAPGVCVACHGGDHYAGKYPEDGSGRVDVGGHFLPYDTGNLAFSSQSGLTEAAQELSIYNLNQNVLQANPSAAEATLIAGWYTGGSKTLNKAYIAPSWLVQSGTAQSFYQSVNAHSCRTCHVALGETYNLEHYPMGGSPNALVSPADDLAATLCANVSASPRRAHSMPNSMVTYNRFWLSSGTGADQPAAAGALISALGTSFVFSSCGN